MRRDPSLRRVTTLAEVRAALRDGGEVVNCNLWHDRGGGRRRRPRFHWATVRMPPTEQTPAAERRQE